MMHAASASKRLARCGVSVLLAGFALAGTAQAQRQSPITGAKLVESCSSKDKTALEACEAYIEGVSDSVLVYQSLRPQDGSKGPAFSSNAYICIPASTTGVQIRDAWLTWAKQNSGDLSRHATPLVLRALRDTHPCPATSGAGATSGGAPKR